MPKIFLSPSTQEYNPYIDGGSEEYYMNLIADAMIPYLEASGIEYGRNNPQKGISSAVAASNAGNYGLHLAIHSNASYGEFSGKLTGTQIYYYPSSAESERAAIIFANNFKEIYPNPEKVKIIPTTKLGELSRTKAPAILIEVAYHDNPKDAKWIRDNIGKIAQNLSISAADYFGLGEKNVSDAKVGKVTTQSSNLNLRKEPSESAEVIDRIPKESKLYILGEANNWYLVSYNGKQGYVAKKYVTII